MNTGMPLQSPDLNISEPLMGVCGAQIAEWIPSSIIAQRTGGVFVMTNEAIFDYKQLSSSVGQQTKKD